MNRNLETGVLINWTTGTQDTRYAIAAKYCVDKDTTLRVSKIQSEAPIQMLVKFFYTLLDFLDTTVGFVYFSTWQVPGTCKHV